MSNQLAFTVYCLENYKEHRSLSGKQTQELFAKYGVFEYIKDFFDVLHTTGVRYLMNDIDIYLRARNAEFPA